VVGWRGEKNGRNWLGIERDMAVDGVAVCGCGIGSGWVAVDTWQWQCGCGSGRWLAGGSGRVAGGKKWAELGGY
jgi:hypothetical protein